MDWLPIVPGPEPGRTQVPVPPETLMDRGMVISPPFRDGEHAMVPCREPSGPDRCAQEATRGCAVGGGAAAGGGIGAGTALAAASALAFSSSAFFLSSSFFVSSS